MTEYIEREALRDSVDSIDWYSVYKGKLTAGSPSSANALYKANEIYSAIDNAPAADVVTVVRCKDCKHWQKDFAGCTEFVGRCDYANYMIGANGYCLYGEKMEEGADNG